MTTQPPPLYVTGHRNPDTDSLVSAHVLAWMYQQVGTAAVALRLGEPNPQSAWIFQEAGVELPLLREDCRTTAAEACGQAQIVRTDAPLRKALRLLQENKTTLVPVVDKGGAAKGVISAYSPRMNYLLRSNVEDMLGTLLSWPQVVDGLGLTAVNSRSVEREIRGMKFATGREAPGKSDVLVCGAQPPNVEGLLATEPAAIILVGPGECTALQKQDRVPVFAYPGSVFAFCSSLCECFTCEAAMDTDFSTVDPEAVLSSTRPLLAESPQGVLVMSAAGELKGVLAPRHVVAAAPPRVVLVDHFERSQSIAGLDEAEIVAVVDHHRLGDIETLAPVDIDCRSWGSTASILFARCKEAEITVPPPVAKLLLGAIVSDTLLLRSPTTHDKDRSLAAELADIAGVELESFGEEVLRRNDRLLDAAPDELVMADCKVFSHGKVRFMASQIETVNLRGLDATRARELEDALSAQAEGMDFSVLMITDVMEQTSRISILSGEASWTKRLIANGDPESSHWLAEGFVSRKKQLIPYLLKKLPKDA